ncbi:hypothetical protein [Pantoea piersonii]|uniref:hypothetical protein n=1 Tax=Pantoea piersonii TaxID=2364647 RepID=UPI0028976932|nr:hypothetical protein [Pantoea piersonii]
MTANSSGTSSFAIIFPVVCTLLGGAITSGLTWVSTYQAASLAQKNACILQFDQQEKEIRAKAGNFLSAYGDIVAYLTVAERLNPVDMQKSSAPLFKAGFELVAYAPSDLSITTAQLLAALKDNVVDEINGEKSEQHQKTAAEVFGNWTHLYSKQLLSLKEQKNSCK